MKPLREVSKREKIIFPILVTAFVALLVPSAAPLIACLMLGNLFRECGVVDRLSKTAQNELINIVTIFLGVSVGATATAKTFLSFRTIAIMVMGVLAFAFGTAGGVLLAKFMNLFLKDKINPLIGSAGVSAVPMAIVVTGAAGFIGANIVKGLNLRGQTDIIAVDDLTLGDQFKNLVDCDINHYLDKHAIHDKVNRIAQIVCFHFKLIKFSIHEHIHRVGKIGVAARLAIQRHHVKLVICTIHGFRSGAGQQVFHLHLYNSGVTA